MDDLLAARLQMAFSLGFHIIFAAIGVAMPFLMAAAHALHLLGRGPGYRTLTKAWSRGVAIFFAVGAVSGTALSFELGLLWPRFMEHAGPIIGMPFSWEGTAFFLEAIAIGIFLYGWGRVRPWTHWASGLVTGIAGVASAFFVICANGWMNSPAGFDWNGGDPVNIDPWAAMFNDAAFLQGLHMVVAAFQAVGFGVAGIHAGLYLRTRYAIHRQGVMIAFVMAALASIAQPIVGDFAAKSVARRQPVKLAAMEALFDTQARAPLLIGGLPDAAAARTEYAIELPGMLSFLAHGEFSAVVKGLKDFPREDWPPVLITHLAFQLMVGVGGLLLAVSLAGVLLLWRKPEKFFSPGMLRLLVLCAPLGFLAIEAGWTVTEVGRQPWIIQGLLRTSEALTPRPGIVFTFAVYLGLYLFLAAVVTLLMSRQVQALHRELAGRSEGEIP
ncbi:MAG: cytochrome ubiquinol oxidase subunit I [Oligoflexia bacterium]|nr:cytochrome ubiquinol oxidase subunit I [Oligoflexia bacterium]